MDAYLSRNANAELNAVHLLFSEEGGSGFLLGHKRGHRIHIERIFPSCLGSFPSEEDYFKLKKFFNDKIIGFYSVQPEETIRKKILSPLGQGKLLLEIFSGEEQYPSIQAYLVDYDEAFVMIPIKILSEGSEQNE